MILVEGEVGMHILSHRYSIESKVKLGMYVIH